MISQRITRMPASALAAVGRVDASRVLAWVLLLAGLALLFALIFTPWQQSIRGPGRVIAYAPLERQQAIEAPIDGRLIHWHVQEGDQVQRGDPIAELSDNDPEILARLRRERDAAQTQVDATGLSISLTEARVTSLESARESAIANAKLRVQIAVDRREAATRAADAAKATQKTADLNLERLEKLHGKGLASKRDLELAQLASETSHTELDRAGAAVRAAKSEIEALGAEQSRVASSNQASVESIRSSLEKLKADKAKAEAELTKVEVRLARQEQMRVVAPRAGTILRVLAKQGTEMVKAGEPLVLLVPDANSRAVEVYVDGNDAPLIDPGRHVRLQFEGWPAVQFVGWPSAAVGTFAGTVAFVDAHDDGFGRFRVVVVPENPDDWPDGRYLRQGVRANGWVLLNQVSLGFELWRQFNGFPPALSEAKPSLEIAKKGAK
ncbi:MAG: HlyD family efflux transporter periplasmic adaptor subunit [Myxococcales bacterium FL481]|nr:MAG: HlyD family efflux transporter periplasmic adaptor subunit [Myxococcales bacterium FL481]